MGVLVVGLIAVAGVCFHGVFVLRRLWTDPRYADRMVNSLAGGLPYGPAVQRGVVRGSLPLTAYLRRRFPRRGGS